MALKGDRTILEYRIDYFCDYTHERGGVVFAESFGSGVAMDQAVQKVYYPGNPSGLFPIGVLMNDGKNYDLTRQTRNVHKDEFQVGGKCTVAPKCQIVTNMLVSGITITAGQRAFVGVDGRFTNVDGGAIASPWVGQFDSNKDEDGYAKITVNLPATRR